MDDSIDAAGARVTIGAVLYAAMGTANELASAASSGLLDRAGVLRAFERMHDVQTELVQVLENTAAALGGHASRDEFSNVVNAFLDVELTTGGLALDPAIQAGDVTAAVKAQDAINHYVAGWTAEGIAIGSIGLQVEVRPIDVPVRAARPRATRGSVLRARPRRWRTRPRPDRRARARAAARIAASATAISAAAPCGPERAERACHQSADVRMP
jgi:hypothetical protein